MRLLILLLLVPLPALALTPLPGTEKEAMAVAGLLGSQPVLGGQATKPGVQTTWMIVSSREWWRGLIRPSEGVPRAASPTS